MIKKNKILSFLIVFLALFLNFSWELNSKETKVNVKKITTSKHNQGKKKSHQIKVQKIAGKPNNKKKVSKAVSKSNNAKVFYLNGQKFFYEHERSPTDYKLNNFCFLAVDAKTGNVLFAKNPNEKCYPASLTKLMTLYILFEQLQSKKLKMNSRIYFSNASSSKQRMKLGVAPGDSISAIEAIQALIILSANDVAAAVGEKIAGSEARFGELMTRKAKELGMNSTSFQNASGLFHPNQKTTAIDLIRLGIAIKKDFPEYYHFFSRTSFAFRGRVIHGHNSITREYEGAEGLKTGFVKASGFNIVSSATRNGKTIFAAVLGAGSRFQRDEYMKNLLDQSFMKLSYSSKKQKYSGNYQARRQFEERDSFAENYYDENMRPVNDNQGYQLISFNDKERQRRNFVLQ